MEIPHLHLGWILFGPLVLALLATDLILFHRDPRPIDLRRSLQATAGWVALALAFGVVIALTLGTQPAMEFFTGYIVELSLSVDNVFVFAVLLAYFAVPEKAQFPALFWGIIGALFLRALFIFTGIALINRFHWLIYVFGALLVYTGIKLLKGGDAKVQPDQNPLVRIARKFIPITPHFHDGHFFVRQGNRWTGTPLFLVLIALGTTDLVFAIDSIPAILAITRDPFIVLTSNAFAVLGLRALYFAIAGLIKLFAYLNIGLAVILSFIGVKMLISGYIHLPIPWTLGFVLLVLAVSILASIYYPPAKPHQS
ncbi:MAG: TerC family protein [Verrucomicrobiota bacterium]